MRTLAHRLLIAATSAGTLSSANAMEITREQCELIRGELITSISNAKAAQEGLKRAQLAMLDLATLNFELQHVGGTHDVSPITDRVQKAIDEVSAASKEAVANTNNNSPQGALAFMRVCGPPPS
ncbi:exported hypothetical protein [Mesorhizobium sp. ORS 3359]|nr:exported hypothetical protein [Mesorhizobium sp. ORS 3359]